MYFWQHSSDRRRYTKETKDDIVLCRATKFVLNGWTSQFLEDLESYHVPHDKLSLEHGCVLYGSGVVITGLQMLSVFVSLHVNHPWASPIKMVARILVWWPGIDQCASPLFVKEFIMLLDLCRYSQKSYPAKCRQRIYADFATKSGHVIPAWVEPFL